MDNMKNVDNGSYNGGALLRMGLNDNKAGMQGLDKEKINKIIMEASKGSKFYENELKKDQQVNQRIEKMMQLKEKITQQQLLKAQLQVDKLVMELEQSRNLSCTIVHIDMDAFYAAVEMRDNPELKERPIAVGSMSMLSTSNYHARRFGVRAAMPGFIAKKLCPHLTIVPLNFEKYRKVSKEVKEILAEYDPHFMPMGLDEAYLNVTEHLEERLNWPEDKRRYFLNTENTTEKNKEDINISGTLNIDGYSSSPELFEDGTSVMDDHSGQRDQSLKNVVVFGTSAEEAVKEIRFRIEQKTQLTASAGIAPNTMLAKMCSDRNKPNGQCRISPERQAVLDFIKDLPIRKVPGIGKVTEKMLKALGIVTCSELYQQRALLSLLFSEASWRSFLDISLGLGSTHLEKYALVLLTFSEINTAEDQYSLCRELCRELAQDLQKEGLKVFFILFTFKRTPLCTQNVVVVKRVSLQRHHSTKSATNFHLDGHSKSQLSWKVLPENICAKHSFFDKKRAARQLNCNNVFPSESVGKQHFHGVKSSANFVEEANKVTGLQKSNVCEIFTCPVCFEEQSSSNLEEINRHVDECLAGSLVKESVEISKNDFSRENTFSFLSHCKNENIDDCKENITDQLAGTGQSGSTSENSSGNGKDKKFTQIVSEKPHREKQPGDLIDIPRNASIKQCLFPKRNSQENAEQFGRMDHTEETSSSCSFEAKEDSVLVCPVCNSEQKTTSLMSFNRHVDVCLNKGLIQELTEKGNRSAKTSDTENSIRVGE
uniref:DNA polymerase kappa n=1 Tax=Pavo cristatus TaxID=9049 RepID=A0A8C9L988_PAVCR